MNRLQQDAVLATLADQLRRKGSWCGETHLQKATYFLQELLKVPTGFSFILYKHGPFSFDLRDELTAMRADGLLELRAQWPYGPSLVPTERSVELRERFSKTVSKYERHIDLVAEHLGSENVAGLEKLATALYITLEGNLGSVGARAKRIHSLKLHVSLDEASKAVQTVDAIARAARGLLSCEASSVGA